MQGGIGRYLYASTYSRADAVVRPWHDISCGDLVGLPMLSTDALTAASSGSEHTRVEKTLRVADLPVTYRTLDVCARGRMPPGNCSACIKCLRTLLTLEIAGVVDRYAPVFDLDDLSAQARPVLENGVPEPVSARERGRAVRRGA